jgi:hypothetical protein
MVDSYGPLEEDGRWIISKGKKGPIAPKYWGSVMDCCNLIEFLTDFNKSKYSNNLLLTFRVLRRKHAVLFSVMWFSTNIQTTFLKVKVFRKTEQNLKKHVKTRFCGHLVKSIAFSRSSLPQKVFCLEDLRLFWKSLYFLIIFYVPVLNGCSVPEQKKRCVVCIHTIRVQK